MVARYHDQTIGGSAPNEHFTEPSELSIRWALPGGVSRIEITIKARSKDDAYRRYMEHLGDTFGIYDTSCHSVITGQCYEVIPDGSHVTYVCAGAWKRANDDFYNVGDFPATGNTDAIIKDILTDSVAITNADQTNIGASSVAIGGWIPDHTPGTYAGNAIAELALVGDSADAMMDFYFVDHTLDESKPNLPIPYYKSRSATASPDWIFSIEDLAPNGLTMARNIWNLKTLVWIAYGRWSGVHDGGNGANALIDASENFSLGVRPGDTVINITDNEVHEVDSISKTGANWDTLNFVDNATGNWDNNDVYSVKLRDPLWTAASAESSDYWSVFYREIRPEMDKTQAEQYRDQLAATYSAPVQQQAFVISAPTIKDSSGVQHPLWRVFTHPSFYFRADNIFPDEAIFADSDDRAHTWMATAMDYTHSNYRLRIVPSSGDSRLDSILNQAGIINAQMISTEAAWRLAKRQGEI
jgi:hypothetical protein